MALRRLPIRRAGNRITLVLGCDRELIMSVGVLAFALVFNAQSIVAVVYGAGFWFASLWALRRMAKSDPLMRHVYLRDRKYKKFYPARSTPFRIDGGSRRRYR